MPKVSVIVPVYGVEKYIERCAKSLLEQTLDDMEFIFVDDCTNDNSIQVLKEVISKYPMRSSQIRILHHEVNKGLSRARETGVKEATGTYIAHCDSDDWVEPNMYEELLRVAIKGSSDFVKCDHFVSDDQHNIGVKRPTVCENSYSNQNIISMLLTDKGWNSIWSTLTKRELYKDVSFTENAMLEDYFVVSQLLIKANKITYLNCPLYHYYVNTNSICKKNSKEDHVKRALQARDNAYSILIFIEKKYGSELFCKESVVLKYIARRMLIPVMNDKTLYSVWNSIFPELKFSPVLSQYFTTKEKIQYLMVQLHLYSLYCTLFK